MTAKEIRVLHNIINDAISDRPKVAEILTDQNVQIVEELLSGASPRLKTHEEILRVVRTKIAERSYGDIKLTLSDIFPESASYRKAQAAYKAALERVENENQILRTKAKVIIGRAEIGKISFEDATQLLQELVFGFVNPKQG